MVGNSRGSSTLALDEFGVALEYLGPLQPTTFFLILHLGRSFEYVVYIVCKQSSLPLTQRVPPVLDPPFLSSFTPLS